MMVGFHPRILEPVKTNPLDSLRVVVFFPKNKNITPPKLPSLVWRRALGRSSQLVSG